MPRTFIFMGRSGAGKGVQVKLLQDWLRREDKLGRPIVYIETGELLRQFVRETNHLTSTRAAAVMGSGGRLADFLPIYIWSRELINRLQAAEHLILDGVARSLNEARTLQTALAFYERAKPVVVYLNISAETAATRLTGRGRADDIKSSSNQARQRWFDEEVLPVIDYYRRDPFYQFVEINGEQAEMEVHQSIVSVL